VDAALRWGHKTPRKAALERLTTWGEHDRAHALAADDADAAIRAWGRKLRTEVATQSSLFDRQPVVPASLALPSAGAARCRARPGDVHGLASAHLDCPHG
jgi:hypothetical protein